MTGTVVSSPYRRVAQLSGNQHTFKLEALQPGRISDVQDTLSDPTNERIKEAALFVIHCSKVEEPPVALIKREGLSLGEDRRFSEL